MSEIKCSQCHKILTDEYWSCYYADEYYEDNMLCGDGSCWAEWMQINTQIHEIEREETNE